MTKEQQELRAKVREFAEREVKPVASYNDENEIFDVDLTLKMSKLGLLGMCISEDYGGRGGGGFFFIISLWGLCRVGGF